MYLDHFNIISVLQWLSLSYLCSLVHSLVVTLTCNLQPLANSDKGWFRSIIMIVAIAPWAYVGFDNIPQTAEEFNSHQIKHLN